MKPKFSKLIIMQGNNGVNLVPELIAKLAYNQIVKAIFIERRSYDRADFLIRDSCAKVNYLWRNCVLNGLTQVQTKNLLRKYHTIMEDYLNG